MDWFKHDTASIDDPDVQEAEEIFGDAGYAVFFKLLEIYGKEFNHLEHGNLTISKTVLRRKLRKSWAKAEQILSFYQEKNRIFFTSNGTRVSFSIPTFHEKLSSWVTRQYNKTTKAPTEAPTEAPTKKLQTEVRSKNKDIRVKKNIKKKKTLSLCVSEFVNMTDEEILELLKKHDEDFFWLCIDKLSTYKGSTGREYKSDYMAIRSWVIKSVREDAPKEAPNGKYPI